MGTILTLPISIFVDYIWDINSEELRKGKEDFGILLWLKYIVTVFLAKIFKKFYKKQFCDYSVDFAGAAEKLGICASKAEWNAEIPIDFSSDSKYMDDGVFFYGGNSKGDCLLVRFCRKNSGKTEVSLCLKVANRGCYELPLSTDMTLPNDYSKTFAANGLEIRCLSPFRRWRISFNGLLREVNNDDGKGVHIKFSFIWIPTNTVIDLQTNQSSFLLAEATINRGWNIVQNITRILSDLNCYEHWGQCIGTLSVDDDPEVEMYCWGVRERERRLSYAEQACHNLKLYGYTVNGFIFHIGRLLCSRGRSHYVSYGCIILPNRRMVPIDKFITKFWEMRENESDHFELQFLAGRKIYNIVIQQLEIISSTYSSNEEDVQEEKKLMKFKFGKTEGHGVIVNLYRNQDETELIMKPKLVKDSILLENVPMVLDLNDESCQNTAISGGKGASLSCLIALRKNAKKESNQQFHIPPGIIVTTSAYKYHLQKHKNLQKAVLSISSRQSEMDDLSLEERCKRVVTEFHRTLLDDCIVKEVATKVCSLSEHPVGTVRYAVRSSAIGEDGTDFSSAGQLDTILGVQNSEICQAIVKCWSSQFSYAAIQYKRQNGQPLDSGMAVIIQEMVLSEISGVMFTCDPVTYNPAYITITASYGLGEAVVSALVEPDMVKLHRSLNGTITYHCHKIGSKEFQLNLEDAGKVQKDNDNLDKTKCCLSEKQALHLGTIAIQVEQHFGKLQDIEWAIVGKTLYLLQARPVTTFNKETEFELCHEMDSGLLAEFEYCTTANVGEVMSGAMTPLTVSTTVWALDLPIKLITKIQEGRLPSKFNWPFLQTVVACQHHIFFSILDFVLMRIERKETLVSRIWEVCLLGRLLEEDIGKEMKQRAIERYGYFSQARKTLGLLTVVWVAYRTYGKTKKMKEKYSKYEVSYQRYNDCFELYQYIQDHLPDMCEIAHFHVFNSFLSSVFTTFVLSVLGNEHEGDELFAKFSQLLSHCSGVKSADVSLSLKEIAATIAEQKEDEAFLELSSKEAYNWLINDSGPSGKVFREFMHSHGYRCIKEYDLYSKRWEEQPHDLVSCVQTMLKGGNLKRHFQKKLSVKEAIDELGLSLGFISRKFLEVFTSWGRHGVRAREESKALIVKSLNAFRHSYLHLGKLMTSENRLPDPELVFFLTHDEIGEVISEKSAQLVHKAIQRRKLYGKMDKFVYPEIMCGPPKQVNMSTRSCHFGSSKIIKGTPASKGSANGIARVILNIEDASYIKMGDILITNSTDVGWTPYFPLLSGVVTELGGLISHGAVVAREYGLPCIVGAKGAIQCFSSELPVIKRKFAELPKDNFPGIIGTIDCTHFPIQCPDSNEGRMFINRKGFYSINCLVIMSFLMELMAC